CGAGKALSGFEEADGIERGLHFGAASHRERVGTRATDQRQRADRAATDGALHDRRVVFDARAAAHRATEDRRVWADVDRVSRRRGRATAAVVVAREAAGTRILLAALKPLGPRVAELHQVGVPVDGRVRLVPDDLLLDRRRRHHDQEQRLTRLHAKLQFAVGAALQLAVARLGDGRVGRHQTPAKICIGTRLADSAEGHADAARAGFRIKPNYVVAPALRRPIEGRHEAPIAGIARVERFELGQTQTALRLRGVRGVAVLGAIERALVVRGRALWRRILIVPGDVV